MLQVKKVRPRSYIENMTTLWPLIIVVNPLFCLWHPPPRFWGDLIFKNAGFLGGTCDFEKKVGGPLVPGDIYFWQSESGGTCPTSCWKTFKSEFFETRLSHLSFIFQYHGFCNKDLGPLLGFFSCFPIPFLLRLQNLPEHYSRHKKKKKKIKCRRK